MNAWRSRLAYSAALVSLAILVALACDDREDRVPKRGGEPGAGGSTGQLGGASAQGGAYEPMPSAGEPGAAGTEAAAGDAGGADGAGGAPCDALCLESVVNQISDFGMTWQSSWFLMGCKETRLGRDPSVEAGRDCLTVLPYCPAFDTPHFEDKGVSTLETFPIGGVPGQRYKVTFTFNAIASAKDYRGGSRDQGSAVPADPDVDVWDTFYRDGEPIPSSYDPWKLSVFDEEGVELRHYYMNAFPAGAGFESHRTFLLSYTKSIVVVGGGKVTHRMMDTNCRAIDNCGAGSEGACTPRYLPNEPMSLMPPAMYQDLQDGMLKPTSELTLPGATPGQPWHSQLGHLTVIAVEETDDPVSHDYL